MFVPCYLDAASNYGLSDNPLAVLLAIIGIIILLCIIIEIIKMFISKK